MNPATQQPSNQATPQQGWIVSQYTSYRGKRLGPYYVRCWKVNGKIRKQYIKPHELEHVRKACQENRERRLRGIQIAADFNHIVGNINWLQRMARRAAKGRLRLQDYEHIGRVEKHGVTSPGRTALRCPNLFRSQYTTPKTQHPILESSFMYPRSTNPLAVTTRRLLKKLKARIDRTFGAKFARETMEIRWQRIDQDLAAKDRQIQSTNPEPSGQTKMASDAIPAKNLRRRSKPRFKTGRKAL